MRHLLLYEAFKSKGISNTLKYLNDNDIDNKPFLNDLKTVMNNYNIPISEITDSDINYMTKIKAELIKPDKDYDIMNPFGVYTIKFWFSVSEGYLGCSITPNISVDSDINSEELEELGTNGGSFIKIKHSDDIINIKTGDVIVGRFRNSRNKLEKAIAFVDSDNRVFAIQDKYNGSSPDDIGWRKYGEYSWFVASLSGMGNDTYDLYLYTESDSEFILNRTKGTTSVIKGSDFCLVIYLDNLIRHDSVEDIRSTRDKIKSGALAFKKPEDIKKANYKRYVTEIIKRMGFEEDSNLDSLKDLEKVVQKTLGYNWSLISLINDYPGLVLIDNFIESIKFLLKEEEKEISRIIKLYEHISTVSNDYKKIYTTSSKIIDEHANESVKELFNMIYKLNEILNKKISESKLETLEDLIMIKYKLEYLRHFIKNDISLSKEVTDLLTYFMYNNQLSFIIRGYNLENNESDLRKLEKINRFIEKTF